MQVSDDCVVDRLPINRDLLIREDDLLIFTKNVKLGARARLKILADPDSFEEIGSSVLHRCTDFDLKKSDGDGVITGFCTIYGKTCCVFIQDFSNLGGSLGEMHARKICKIMDIAADARIPIIGINDSGGARIQEGVSALSGYGDIFQRNVNISGYIPQISLIMGPCAGGAVYSPALTDFIFMTKGSSFMFVTGPNVVKTVTYEDLTKEELGGSKVHNEKSGVVDMVANNDIELLEITRRFVRDLPCNNIDLQNNKKNIISNTKTESRNLLLSKIIPNDSNKSYNVKLVIKNVVDYDSFFEIKADFAKNIVIGFAKIVGQKVGIVANQSAFFAGCLDIDSSFKAARFIRFCDAFNIPIITFVDTPGFLPGKIQEHNGIIKHGAKLAYAYAEATVPKITIITRKAYGGAYIVMGSKHLGADFNFAWPKTEIAVMGVDGAAPILFKKFAHDKEKMKQLLEDYRENIVNPKKAAAMNYIDEIIKPEDTRQKIVNALFVLQNKEKKLAFYKKHDNLPL